MVGFVGMLLCVYWEVLFEVWFYVGGLLWVLVECGLVMVICGLFV